MLFFEIGPLYTAISIVLYINAGSAMAETHDDAVLAGQGIAPDLDSAHEELLGRIVIAMLRAGSPVSRKTLFLKIAFLMNETEDACETLLYEGIFRLLLNADRLR